MRPRADAISVDCDGPVGNADEDRSIYSENPAGNALELWDFFRGEEGAAKEIDALTPGGDRLHAGVPRPSLIVFSEAQAV